MVTRISTQYKLYNNYTVKRSWVIFGREWLKISEFSKLSGISRKLLIFYDNHGLLHPERIDESNGYRYYSYRQIDTASVIVSLREAGMSLSDIKDYLNKKSPELLIDLLGEQAGMLNRQIRKLHQIQEMIQFRIQQTQKGLKSEIPSIWIEQQAAENIFLGPTLPDDYDFTDGWTHLPAFYAKCQEQDIQLGYTVGTMISKTNLLKNVGISQAMIIIVSHEKNIRCIN
ncbi:MerR family transcriptional regulator [Enterococcus sp.]|uniref:MerR family transcriptional regulator n=1 Tax=Enterococcus sp. TaxID=35783 RepID=UPI002912199D|nr:MerR family transcriptional regulator [Enterococcus sp.]MDU5333116.1 MerR family transcriptional regulator [Enterococcus sp.]